MEQSPERTSTSFSALASSPKTRVGIYRTDAQGRCVYVSRSLCDLFEISADEAMDLGWLRRVHPSDRARVTAAREKAISSLPSFYLEYGLQLSGGRTIWVSAFSTALMERGQFKGRSGLVTAIPAPTA